MVNVFSIFVVMLFLMIGEWVSKITRSLIPSVFVTAILFVIGFWTFLPKNIVASATFDTNFEGLCLALILVHLGTLMSLKQLLNQWKAVCIALFGVIGTVTLTLFFGNLLFNWHSVVASIPPLSGGLVSVLIMTNGLKTQGLDQFIALPVSMLVLHSIFGYPLTSYLLKSECKRLLKHFDKNKGTVKKPAPELYPVKTKIPADYKTSAFLITKVALVGVIAQLFSMLIHNAINVNVIYLVFGVLAHQFGFLEAKILNKAGVANWLMYGLMAYIFSQLSLSTPQGMLSIIGEIFVLIVLGIFGMFITSFILSKPFKMSWQMSFACALTALFGFPADYIMTSEVTHNIAKNKKEENYLLNNIMPKMLVGGFATVSVASVVIASIFLKIL